MFIERHPNMYKLSVGKVNFKEHFTGLEDPKQLIQGVDEDL